MLCALSLRRSSTPDGTAFYALRVIGKAALGPSGSGGQDERRFPSPAALIGALEDLQLNTALVQKAEALMQAEAHTQRFVPIAAEVQIPFGILEGADFYLAD